MDSRFLCVYSTTKENLLNDTNMFALVGCLVNI